jgi:hypothetical protein
LLFERGDWQNRKLLPGPIPIIPKLLQVNDAPTIDEVKSRLRQMSFINRSGLDLDQRFVRSVDRVKVRWRMIAISRIE